MTEVVLDTYSSIPFHNRYPNTRLKHMRGLLTREYKKETLREQSVSQTPFPTRNSAGSRFRLIAPPILVMSRDPLDRVIYFVITVK